MTATTTRRVHLSQPPEHLVADRAATHRIVDDLVRAGLPEPRRRTVTEYGHDERVITLTFDTLAELDLWADELASVEAVPLGPWRIGPRAYRVRVGRLGGVPTVLRVEVPLDQVPDVVLGERSDETAGMPRDPHTTCPLDVLADDEVFST